MLSKEEIEMHMEAQRHFRERRERLIIERSVEPPLIDSICHY